jgi:hypothetical protein
LSHVKFESELNDKRDLLNIKRDLLYIKRDLLYIKRDLLHIKKDLLPMKRDLLYIKRDPPTLAYLRYLTRMCAAVGARDKRDLPYLKRDLLYSTYVACLKCLGCKCGGGGG